MNDPSTSRKAPIRRKIASVFNYIKGPWSTRGALGKRLAVLEAKLRRLELSQTIYLGNHEALTRLHTGHRIYVDTRDVSIASHLMLEGSWEPWVERVLIPAIKPGMSFVDVGANFGYFSLLGAEMVGATGHIYSFEANPTIFQKLVKSIAVNGFNERVSLFNVAVHDASSPMEILFRHDASGGGWTDIAKRERPGMTEVFPVQGEPLDILLADVPNIDVIKIDVEGAEPKVLAGAKNLIARSRNLTIILEFDARRVMQQTPQEYLQNFELQGFSLAIAEPTGLTQRLSPAECVSRLSGSVNYLILTR